MKSIIKPKILKIKNEKMFIKCLCCGNESILKGFDKIKCNCEHIYRFNSYLNDIEVLA